MSELDRFRRAAPGFENASDDDVVREISRRTKQPFESVADTFNLPVRGFTRELGRQLAGGFAVDTPDIIGGALQYFGRSREIPEGGQQTGLETFANRVREITGLPETTETPAFRLGSRLRAGAEERAPGFEPDMRGRGQTAQYALQGARATAPVLTGLAPALLGPVGVATSVGLLPAAFAGSAAQDTYENLISQGIAPEQAAAAARGVFNLTLGGEGLATVATLGAARAVPLFRGRPRSTEEVSRRLTDTSVVRPAAGAIAANLPVQIGTELIQELGQVEIERAFGGQGEDLVQLAKDTAAITGFMTLFLGPLSFGGARARARRSQELKDALFSDQASPQVRAEAMDVVMAEARRQNVAPENVDTWFNNLIQQEDARTEALAAAEERASAEALSQRSATLEDMVKEQGLMRPVGVQDLMAPGETSAARIDDAMGITRKPIDSKKYVKAFEKAFTEPSGQFVSDPETGVERQLTLGEVYQRDAGVLDLMQDEPAKTAVASEVAANTLRDPRAIYLRNTFGVIPTPTSLQLLSEIEQSGIPVDSDLLSPVWTYAAKGLMSTQKSLDKARQLLDKAVIDARSQPEAQAASQLLSSTEAGTAGQGVLPAAVPAAAGLSTEAELEQTLGTRPNGGFSPATENSASERKLTRRVIAKIIDDGLARGDSNDQILDRINNTSNTLSSAAILDVDAIITRKRNDVQAPVGTPTPATPAAAAIQESGTPATTQVVETTPAVDPRIDALATIFGDRNANIMFDVMGMGMPLAEAAQKYNMSTSNVGKIAGMERDAVNRRTKQIERAVARGVDVSAVEGAFGSMIQEASEQRAQDIESGGMQNMFDIAAATEQDAEAAGLEGRIDTAGGSEANTAAKITESEQRMFEVLEALATETDPQIVAALQTELETFVQRAKNVNRRNQQEVRRTAGRQTEVAVDGEADAVQEQTAAEVSAQPEPATEGQVQTRQEVVPAGNIPSRVTALRSEYTQLQRRLDEDGKSAGDDPLGQALSATHNPLQRDDKDAQLFALNYGEQNNRPDIAAEARANLEALADKLEQEAASQSTTPGVPESSPKYQKIKSNLEARKAQKIADAAEIRVRLGQAPSQSTAQTTQESYAQVVSAVPGAPAFADLTKAQQDQITDLANRNQLNLAAVNRIIEGDTRAMIRGEPAEGTEGRELSETMDSLARGMTRVGGVTDLDGNKVDLTPTTPEALSRVAALAEVLNSYNQLGWGNSLNAVQNWYITSTPVTWDGVFTTVDGKPSVVLNARVLMTLPEESAWTLRHEIGHAIDQVQHGGNYSANSLFNVSVTADRIIPRGQLMQDVVNFRTNNPDSELAQHLKYPLDMEHTGRLSVDVLRQEVFGQLWAFYSGSQANRNFMEDNLPFVFDYFDQGVSNEVKSTDYESDAGSASQTASQQEQAATQAEGVQSGQVRSSEQVQGVLRANTRQPRSLAEQNLNRVPTQARGPARALASMLEDIGGRFLDRAMFTYDLTQRAVKLGMDSAAQLQRTLAARDFMAREEERSVESILNGYVNLSEAERGAGDGSVNRFLFDSTRSAKWGYGDKADPAMAKRFDAFSEPAQKFIRDMFGHSDSMLQRKKSLVLNATQSEYDVQIENAKTKSEKAELRKDKQAAMKRYESLFKIREGNPYAPIKRNGNYVVIAMSQEYKKAMAAKDAKLLEKLESDGNHYHVSFTNGKAAGQFLRQQLEEQGSFADVQLAERDQVTDELFSNESAVQQLTKLRTNVDARVKAGDASAGKMLDIINQMYLEALSEGSARKSEMKRRAVDGEVDMISSFGQQGRADATFLASLQYNDAVNNSLNSMRAQAKTGDRTRKSEVLNELVRRYADSLDVPRTPVLDKLTRMSSVYFLASSPAYYLQNLTQPFMMSVPSMAGSHNYLTVVSELGKAYSELGPVMRSAKLFSQQLDFSKVPDDVRPAINELVNRGRIDFGLESEMGEFKIDGDGRVAKNWNRVDKGLRMAVQKGEAVNRLSTGIAAYRLEFAKTKDAKKAIDYADRILIETHGDYSRYNAPRIFNTRFGKVALQFRKFQLIQLSWYAKMINEAYTNPKERAVAIKSLAFGLAHTGVLAGAMGLPGYAAIAWALSTMFGDKDEPFDLTDEMRKMIGDPKIADVILRGAPVLGGSDWSGKIGAGNMLSIMPFSNADLTTRSGFYEGLGTVIGGASSGMVVRGIDGLGLVANGDYMKGAELLLPKGLGDMIKAYRLSEDGATRRNNDVILPAGELGALELVWQAIGIPPAQMTAMYEKQQRVRSTEQRFRDRTSRIKNDYVAAVRSNNTADAAKARDAWKNLQDARAKAGLKRQPFSNLFRAPREQMLRERRTQGGIQFNRSTQRMVEDITER